MKKVFFSRVLRGFTAGVALNCVICLFSSYWLKLGYYAPCIVSLTEPCGGRTERGARAGVRMRADRQHGGAAGRGAASRKGA